MFQMDSIQNLPQMEVRLYTDFPYREYYAMELPFPHSGTDGELTDVPSEFAKVVL